MKSSKVHGAVDPNADSQARAEVVDSLLSPNCDASAALVRRTRYVVRDSAVGLEEQRVQQRHDTGLALLALFTVLILLTPVIWNGMEELMEGEHFADLPCQVTLLLLMLAPAMLSALAVILKEHWSMQHDRSDS